MQRVGLGYLRLVVDEPRSQAAVDGDGGDGGDGPKTTGWTIVEGAITRMGGEQRVVEIAGWRRNRFVMNGNALRQATPDWICEPAETDRAAQLARYGRHGIGHVWLIDASTRTIDVYRFVSSAYSHIATSRDCTRLRAEPFTAFSLDLSSLWNEPGE